MLLRAKIADMCSTGARWEAKRPYTDVEKAWLNKHFSSEFAFLRQYGLSIHKDEDREEGKRILRTFMGDDLPNGTNDIDF